MRLAKRRTQLFGRRLSEGSRCGLYGNVVFDVYRRRWLATFIRKSWPGQEREKVGKRIIVVWEELSTECGVEHRVLFFFLSFLRFVAIGALYRLERSNCQILVRIIMSFVFNHESMQ